MIEIPDSLKDGEFIGLEDEGRHVFLCKLRGEYHAMSDMCTHARVLLSKGKLRGQAISCPLHGARFDVTTGKCLSAPATEDLQTYAVTLVDSSVQIAVE